MAFGNANISADEVAWAAADKLMLVGRNWLRTTGAEGRWVKVVGGPWGADESEPGYPAAWGYDEHDHLQTYGDALANDWYYVIDLGAAVGEIDCVILLNPSGFATDGVTVEFCEDQDGLFTPSQAAENQDPAGSKRLVFLNLDHEATGTAQRYSEVRYLRIHFDGANIKPLLGEVIIGRRRQLQYNPLRPYDDKRFASRVGRFVSDSGVIKDYVFNKGRRVVAATLPLEDASRITDVETFYKTEIEYGTLPFFWIEEPTTSPSDALWLKYPEDPQLIIPRTGPEAREWQVPPLVEQGPNFLSAGV